MTSAQANYEVIVDELIKQERWMFYEVYIPAKPDDGFDVTITVEADNWMSALKSGLERTGQGSDIRNVMCDIKDDDTIHVTDATTRRVFVLKEVRSEADTEAEAAASEATQKIDLNQADPPGAIGSASSSEADFASGPKSDPFVSREATLTTGATPGEKPPEPFVSRESTLTGATELGDRPTQPLTPPPADIQRPKTPEPVRSDRASGAQTGPPKSHRPPPTPVAGNPSAISPKTEPPKQQLNPPSHVSEVSEAISEALDAAISEQGSGRVETPVATQPKTENSFDARLPTIPDAEEGLGGEKSWTSKDGRISIGSATHAALRRDDHPPKVVREQRAPSGSRPAVETRLEEPSAVSQNVMEEVFLEIQRIHEDMDMEEVISFTMDLSMEKMNAEAGSIMFADLTGTEMYFATARGPKAQQVMDFRIPMGVGIVGFCVREGVSLAISDAEKDPRFYKEISEMLGYQTKNLLCAPIQHEGRVYGAIELLNKSRAFDSNEVSALTYIASQLAKFIHDLIMAQEKI